MWKLLGLGFFLSLYIEDKIVKHWGSRISHDRGGGGHPAQYAGKFWLEACRKHVLRKNLSPNGLPPPGSANVKYCIFERYQSIVLYFLSYLGTTGGEGMTAETCVISKQALFYVAAITRWDTQPKTYEDLYNIPLTSFI